MPLARNMARLEDIGLGDHVCALHDSDEEYCQLATTLLRDGLDRDQKVVHIGDSHTAQQVIGCLRDAGVDVESRADKGQLILLSAEEWYTRGDVFDPDLLVSLLPSEAEKALAEGYAGLRVSAEMSWALRELPDLERLLDYEGKIDSVFQGTKCVGVCHYDRRQFDAHFLVRVLTNHPIVILGSEPFENFYHLPRGTTTEDDAERRLRYWLANLRVRKEAEAALRLSVSHWQDTFDAIDDMVAIINRDYRIVQANRALREAFAESPVIGAHCHRVVHGIDSPPDWCLTCQVFQSGTSAHAEIHEEHLGGRWFEATASPVLDEQGQVAHVVHVLRDITDRRRAEQQLREAHAALEQRVAGRTAELAQVNQDLRDESEHSKQVERLIRMQRDLAVQLSAAMGLEEMLRLCLEGAMQLAGMDTGGVYLVDEETGALDLAFSKGLSPAFVSATSHYEADSRRTRLIMAGWPLYADYRDLDIPKADCEEAEGLRGTAILPVHHGGKVIGCLNVASRSHDRLDTPARNALETIAAEIGSSVARAKAGEALRQSEAMARALLDASSDSSILLRADGSILAVNQTAAERLGKPPRELVGVQVYDLFPPEVAAARRAKVNEVLSSGTPLRYQDQRDPYIFDNVLYPIFDADGKVEALAIFARDITEQVRAEEQRRKLDAQLQYAQKLESLGVMAGGLAHDFNNYLAAILANATIALSAIPPSAEFRGCLESIEKASRRAAELTRQMLAYTGKSHLRIERIDLSKLVEGMGSLLRSSTRKKAVLEYKLAPQLPAIEGDAAQIRQAVMALVTNGAEAVDSPAGRVTASVGTRYCDQDYLSQSYLAEKPTAGDYVYLEVSDTGGGMDPETQERIFDPFFTTKFIGRGLGLAAVLGIVRGHNGAIIVKTFPGRGSSFTLLFPALPEAARDARQQSAEPSEGREEAGAVLVVDDEAEVRQVMTRLLNRGGFRVIAASTGQQAVDLFTEHQAEIACILLDLTMPGMDGEQAYGEIRRIDTGVPVLLATGHDEEQVTARFAGRGIAGVVAKPYQYRGLLDAVRGVLAR